jgi:hypothetical protein
MRVELKLAKVHFMLVEHHESLRIDWIVAECVLLILYVKIII